MAIPDTSTLTSQRNTFAEYNPQHATFHNLFISVRRSTRFRRVFRPSSELKTAPTASGVCQACCWPGQASSR